MPSLRFSSILAGVALSALGVACTTNNGSTSDAGSGDDASATDGDVVSCQSDPRVDTYVANLTKASTSGAVKITLVASDPGPPIRGSNNWTIRVTDGAGAAIPNANVTVSPFMPDHGHGTSIVAQIAAQPDGSMTVEPLYLFMPGVWRITFDVSVGSGDAAASEQVSFFFCIAG